LKIASSYFDLIKDLTLVICLIYIQGFELLFTSFTSFSSVVIWTLIASILAPLIMSGAKTSQRYPLAVLGHEAWRNYRANIPSNKKLNLIKLCVFCFYMVIPSVIINNKVKATNRRIYLLEQARQQFHATDGETQNEILEELTSIEKYLDELRKCILCFKKNESSTEVVMQMTIQLIMLLLSMTTIPAHSGFEAIFSKDFSKVEGLVGLQDFASIFLIISIAWSFKTSCTTYIRIKTEQKSNFLPLFAKIALGLRAFLISVTRISCIVAYFGPFLGLLDCLAHHKAEQVQIDNRTMQDLRHSNSYWDNETVTAIYKPGQERPIPYSEYTIVPLGTAFFIFIAGFLFYGLVVLVAKTKASQKFKKARWTSKLQHIIESLNLPDAYQDWDDETENDDAEIEQTPSSFKKRWISTMNELTTMIILQCCFNLILILPVIGTGMNIRVRHRLIIPRIGAFQQEKNAFALATFLMWFLPSAIVIATMFDLILVYIYMKMLHPWLMILNGDKLHEDIEVRSIFKPPLLQEAIDQPLEEESQV